MPKAVGKHEMIKNTMEYINGEQKKPQNTKKPDWNEQKS